jgi:glycerol-3-phosphate dehydrogenase (NAD(P)+)
MDERITILGAGVWGGTLASIYGCSGKNVSLWDRDKNKLDQLRQKKERLRSQPTSGSETAADAAGEQAATITQSPVLQISEIEAAETIAPINICDELQQAVIDSTIIIFVVTSQSVRDVAQKLSAAFGQRADKNIALVSAVKGLELVSNKTISTVISECLPGYPLAALSGPNLASEIIAGKPAASVIACSDSTLAKRLQSALSTENFRVYAGTDIIGTELGGALKNIIAIAAGFADGMGLGANARAAIVTRGLAEISRLAVALGGHSETLSGLSGMGDLLATCTSPLSRNYQLGAALAKGQDTNEALKHLIGTAEGVPTCDAACSAAAKLNIELPIAQQVQLMLHGKVKASDAIANLMRRPLKSE